MEAERFEDATLLALKMGEGTMNQARSVILEAGKKKEIYSPPGPPEGAQPCWHIGLGGSETVGLGLWNHKRVNLCCSKPPGVRAFVTEAREN